MGHKNLGDELMWDLFKEKFDETFGNENWELQGTIRSQAKNYDIDNYDLIVLGGGSIICKNNTPVLRRAIEKGKKVMIWGSGIDRIDKSDIELLEGGKKVYIQKYFTTDIQKKLVEVIEHAEFAGVRGPLTYELLRQMGANEEKLKISGDPGLLLKNIDKIDEKDKHITSPFKGSKIIGVNWGTSFNHVYGGNEKFVEDQLAEALKNFIKKGYQIYLYSVWNDDIPAMKRLYKKVNDQENVILDTKYYDVNLLIKLLSQFHFTINFKLHANLISLAANTPAIALAYRFKVYDFVQSVDLHKLVISTDSNNINHELMNLETFINKERDTIMNKVNHKKGDYINMINTPFDQKLYLKGEEGV
nr:polysaccharide pyruvyl transferase family protein [Pontibacillus sp. HMF3514]